MKSKDLSIVLVIVAITALASFFVFTIANKWSPNTTENTISVSGQAEMMVSADEAIIYTGASIVKSSASDAQQEVNEIIADIILGLKAAGIDSEDIETEQLTLYEERDWSSGKSEIIGYRASQVLKIRTEDLNKVGDIVDIAVSNGATQISNINFDISDEKEDEYKKQALSEATTNAKEEAEVIASSLGVRLGKIKTVSESEFYYRPYTYSMEKTVGQAAVDEATTVMPGKLTVTAYVNIIYNIK